MRLHPRFARVSLAASLAVTLAVSLTIASTLGACDDGTFPTALNVYDPDAARGTPALDSSSPASGDAATDAPPPQDAGEAGAPLDGGKAADGSAGDTGAPSDGASDAGASDGSADSAG